MPLLSLLKEIVVIFKNIVKPGKNTEIKRECYESSVTIPLERTFRELERGQRASQSESDPCAVVIHQFTNDNHFF